LGGLSIENAGLIGGATGNRRPLALLALLAVAGRRGLSRDKIVALLWPESDAEHGRNSLSQVMSLLRRELASDDVLRGTAELRVNADVLACDVIEFEQHIAADDLEAATELYTGPFLDGVFLKSSPEFERWVDQSGRDCSTCKRRARAVGRAGRREWGPRYCRSPGAGARVWSRTIRGSRAS
jgi:DNA-binding SARP family transcriptional activator